MMYENRWNKTVSKRSVNYTNQFFFKKFKTFIEIDKQKLVLDEDAFKQ